MFRFVQRCVFLLVGFLLAFGARGDKTPEWTEPITGMKFVLISDGTFRMGSPLEEVDREPGESLHTVRLTHAFYLGQTEVTQEQWKKVMGKNPSRFQGCGATCPVENVTWYDVQAFIQRLNEKSGAVLRLPTEAEWEYACRAATGTPFHTGSRLTTDQANYDGRYPYAGSAKGVFRGTPIAVGSFSPNQWGLFDMHGNVWEWTSDPYCAYPEGNVTDPHPSCDSALMVIRGGSWYFGADSARSALRYTHRPQDRGFSIGFRLARDR